jgi:peptidoglycan/xylan/chitin deacetylase (PgdA/CDA1 family)
MPRSLPVLLYHSVSGHENPLAVSPATFNAHLAAMRRSGWRGISLDDAHAFLAEGRPLAPKSILLTFDDGYLDNAVNACPLLAEHGFHAVVFAVSSRLEAGPSRLGTDQLPDLDKTYAPGLLGLPERRDPFLRWSEARQLEDSGVVAVQAHSQTHAPVFAGPGYRKFHKPARRSRTFDLPEGDWPWGLPLFRQAPGLATRAYLPSPELLDLVRASVPQEPAEARAFLKDPARTAAHQARLESLPQERWGRFETGAEYAGRVRADLAACRETMTRELGRAPTALAWPWGAHTPEAVAIAKELGFGLLFTTSTGANLAGRSADHVHRFSVRESSPLWLKSRLAIYSRPWLAGLYGRLRR